MFINSIFNLNSGNYILYSQNPIITEQFIMETAGSCLYGIHDNLKENDRTVSNKDIFFWGPEASYYFLFDNVFDELAFGLRIANKISESFLNKEVHCLLKLVGLEDIINESRFKSPLALSGGQQQRLLTAILFSRRPKIIIAKNPLMYVNHEDRLTLYKVIANRILEYGGLFLVAADIRELIDDVFINIAIISEDDFKIDIINRKDFAEKKENKIDLLYNYFQLCKSFHNKQLLLELQNCRWQYPDGTIGINVNNLKFYSGNIYMVCGPNGGGKSSLVRLLISKYHPKTPSKIIFKNRYINNPFKELIKRNIVSFAFQDPNLQISGGTVRDYFDSQHIESMQYPVISKLKEYLDTDLLSSAFWIRQATIFSSIMLKKAKIMILDEPLDGFAFDIFGNEAISHLKDYASKDSVIILITHNPDLALQLGTQLIWVENKQAFSINDINISPEIKRSLDNWFA